MTIETSKYVNVRPDNVKTLDDLLIKIREKVLQTHPGEWIIGFGWDQE